MIAVERSPTAAAEQSELAVHVLDCRIDLCPHVGLHDIELYCIVVLAVRENSSKFHQLILPHCAQAGIGGRVLARGKKSHFQSLWVENLTLLENLLVVSHASSDVDHLLVTED